MYLLIKQLKKVTNEETIRKVEEGKGSTGPDCPILRLCVYHALLSFELLCKDQRLGLQAKRQNLSINKINEKDHK